MSRDFGKCCQVLDRSILLANLENRTERNRESMRRRRTSRQSDLSTHDQIESSLSNRNSP